MNIQKRNYIKIVLSLLLEIPSKTSILVILSVADNNWIPV